MEKIKTEYCLFEQEEVESIDSVYEQIFGYIDIANEKKSTFEKERKDNKKRIIISSLLGVAAKKIGFLAPEVYEDDDELIGVQEGMLDRYYQQLTTVIREVEDDNHQEISKLIGFVTKKYLRNFSIVENQRRISQLNAAGVWRKRPHLNEDSLLVDHFFNETLDNIVNCRGAVKSKANDVKSS